ncbi:NodT family efflux transporter outer membrane factor (OMF) lipoprotein [Pedobacter cryoconitis]|uniref:NodT family efflux transporter outer membrane factor (OMF) lipoprotein n=1 Tax=Pedobacter cryoconitis TaxID=188932 RepID=A0A7W8ZIV9_9SPHI|nr:efflux transporter outer membrane subunit [Pedobacter cryoconitis]MBB5634773.1 NodT family efflux transporter outer membrane factor (OMF) lipoprotein [Pedobacter cryoconitis]
MKPIYHQFLIPLAIFSGLWSSCKVTQPYRKPAISIAPDYPGADNPDTTNMAALKWSEVFTDTVLNQLIIQGLQANFDLKIAVERINEAKANLKMSKAAFLPEVNTNLSVKQSKLAYPQSFGIFDNSTQYDFGITTAWEIDVWGKLSSAKRAALAGLLTSDAAKRAVQTQLVANIANYYYDLLSLDEQLTVTKKTALNRKADSDAIKLLFESSVLNGVAVVQSEANYYEADLAIPDIEQKIKETEYALSVLLARGPGKIERTSLARQKLDYDLKPGIPAQLLANRPDVQQAEYTFRAAFERTNVAKTNFYPALTITAAGGFSSLTLKDWINSAGLFGNIAGGITQPLFNRGLNKAKLATAQSQQKQALYNFELSLLKASQEVSDALSAYQFAAQKAGKREKQLTALSQAVSFNKELLNYSKNTNYTDVLTAEQNLLTAELKSINDQSQKLRAVVNLYRALGGGWN